MPSRRGKQTNEWCLTAPVAPVVLLVLERVRRCSGVHIDGCGGGCGHSHGGQGRVVHLLVLSLLVHWLVEVLVAIELVAIVLVASEAPEAFHAVGIVLLPLVGGIAIAVLLGVTFVVKTVIITIITTLENKIHSKVIRLELVVGDFLVVEQKREVIVEFTFALKRSDPGKAAPVYSNIAVEVAVRVVLPLLLVVGVAPAGLKRGEVNALGLGLAVSRAGGSVLTVEGCDAVLVKNVILVVVVKLSALGFVKIEIEFIFVFTFIRGEFPILVLDDTARIFVAVVLVAIA